MEYDEIKKEYYETLKRLSKGSGKTVDELNIEISEAMEKSKDFEDIMIKASEIFHE